MCNQPQGKHQIFKDSNVESGLKRIYTETDKLFASFGYEHEQYTGRYKVVNPSNKKIALFAHEGFGLVFLSCLLDIPYPTYCTRFNLSHTGMTVIEFTDNNGWAIPRVLTHSSDSHLYREGLPINY